MGADMRIVVLASMCALFVASCSSEPSCQNELKGRSLSANGKWAAVVFSRNCGATVGDNYQVSIVPNDEAPTGKGNVLVVDQSPPYSDRFKPVWNGNGAVTVLIPPGARVFTKSSDVGSIRVTFRQM